MLSEKVVIDPDRYTGHNFWRRFPGVSLATLISTLNSSKEVEVAYWGMGMPFAEDASYFLLTCSANSPFYKNISQWSEFVINYPDNSLVETLYFWALNFPNQLVKPEELGLKTEKSQLVKPSRIQECYAHLECRLEREMYHQGQMLIVAKILAGYLDQTLAGISGEGDPLVNFSQQMVGYIFPYRCSLVNCAINPKAWRD